MPGQVVPIKIFSGTSAANTAKTVSTDADKRWRLLFATAAYSGSPTQAGVTLTLNSHLGAGFDATLLTGSANARYTTLQPSNEIIIEKGDTFDLLMPAGGGSLTASGAIYVEPVA